MLRVISSTSGESSVLRTRGGAAADHIQVELLALMSLLQDALSEDGNGRKGFEKLRREVEDKGLKLSITEGGKEQNNHLLQVSGGEVYAGSGLENENQAAGTEGEGEEEKVRCEVFAYLEKPGIPEVRKLLRTGLVIARA